MKVLQQLTTINLIDLPDVPDDKPLSRDTIEKILADYDAFNFNVVESKMIDGNGKAKTVKADDWFTKVTLMDEAGETVAEAVD
jgi:hypothetical protein